MAFSKVVPSSSISSRKSNNDFPKPIKVSSFIFHAYELVKLLNACLSAVLVPY